MLNNYNRILKIVGWYFTALSHAYSKRALQDSAILVIFYLIPNTLKSQGSVCRNRNKQGQV